MRTLSLVLLLAASMAFVLVGCSDKSAPVVAPSSVSDKPTNALMKSSESGAFIVRQEARAFFTFFDANSGLRLLLGINDLTSFCDGEGVFDIWSFKDIHLPNADAEPRRMLRLMTGDNVGAIVWHPDPWPNICGSVPLAVGTANVVRTDNDFLAASQDNPNSNAYGFKAHGTLVGPEDQVYQLNFVLHGIWDGVDPASRKLEVKIQLTPTGGK
jgi:hypothetical protein